MSLTIWCHKEIFNALTEHITQWTYTRLRYTRYIVHHHSLFLLWTIIQATVLYISRDKHDLRQQIIDYSFLLVTYRNS